MTVKRTQTPSQAPDRVHRYVHRYDRSASRYKHASGRFVQFENACRGFRGRNFFLSSPGGSSSCSSLCVHDLVPGTAETRNSPAPRRSSVFKSAARKLWARLMKASQVRALIGRRLSSIGVQYRLGTCMSERGRFSLPAPTAACVDTRTDHTHAPRHAPLQILLVVKKTTGGRAWLPKWGFAGLTKAQKANKKSQREGEQQVVRVLKEAERGEPKQAK